MVLTRLKVRLDDGTLIAHNSMLGLPGEDWSKMVPSKANARTFSMFSEADVKRIEGLLAVLSQSQPQYQSHQQQQHHQQPPQQHQHHQQQHTFHAQEVSRTLGCMHASLQCA